MSMFATTVPGNYFYYCHFPNEEPEFEADKLDQSQIYNIWGREGPHFYD